MKEVIFTRGDDIQDGQMHEQKIEEQNKNIRNRDISSHQKRRIGWIDIAKGIAILLLVYKHTINDIWTNASKIEQILIGLIDGFRMPLMFILSAMTCRYSTNWSTFKQNTFKAIKHLLTPAVIIFCFYFLYNIYKEPSNFLSLQYWKVQFYVLIYYSGGYVQFADLSIPGIGISWFFIALLVARILFDFLQMTIPKKLHIPTVLLACCIGVALGKHAVFVLSFDVALVVMPFLYVGYRWKDMQKIKFSVKQKIYLLIGMFLFWFIFALMSYKVSFNLAERRYPLFPICIFVEIVGSFLVMALAKLLEKAKIFFPLQFLGKYCIYFYCAHCIDPTWQEWYQITTNNFVTFLIRAAIDLAIFLVLVALHISIKKIKQNHKRKNRV